MQAGDGSSRVSQEVVPRVWDLQQEELMGFVDT